MKSSTTVSLGLLIGLNPLIALAEQLICVGAYGAQLQESVPKNVRTIEGFPAAGSTRSWKVDDLPASDTKLLVNLTANSMTVKKLGATGNMYECPLRRSREKLFCSEAYELFSIDLVKNKFVWQRARIEPNKGFDPSIGRVVLDFTGEGPQEMGVEAAVTFGSCDKIE